MDAPECAAAALLAAPHLGLHTPRGRLQEQQVEVALVCAGDVLGESCLLGHHVHGSLAIVSSAQLSVLQLQAADVQQLLHPADFQQLLHALRERDAERAQRLAAATSTAGLLQRQQRQLRDMSLAAAQEAAAAAAAAALSCPGAVQQPGQSAAGGQQAVAPLHNAMQHLLPSSAAAAAAAVAAVDAAHGRCSGAGGQSSTVRSEVRHVCTCATHTLLRQACGSGNHGLRTLRARATSKASCACTLAGACCGRAARAARGRPG
jgi:hypothetical protein